MESERKIVLVDDKPSFRSTTKLLLRKIGGCRVTAEFSSGAEFVDNIASVDADLVFMDIEMPGINGIEATRRALAERPELTIIGLSLYDEPTYIEKLIDAGARGYLLKLGDNFSLIETIIKFPTAEIFYSKEIAPNVVKQPPTKKRIVIVEPSQGTRFITEYTLSNRGYDVYAYPSATEAKENLNQINPDLVIADFTITDADVIDFCSEIQSKSSAKCVIMCMKTDEDFLSRVKEAKIAGVLKKPFTGSGLLEMSEKVIYG